MYEEADSLYKQALAIDEMIYGTDHWEVAVDLNNRAGVLKAQVRIHAPAALKLQRCSPALTVQVFTCTCMWSMMITAQQ